MIEATIRLLNLQQYVGKERNFMKKRNCKYFSSNIKELTGLNYRNSVAETGVFQLSFNTTRTKRIYCL